MPMRISLSEMARSIRYNVFLRCPEGITIYYVLRTDCTRHDLKHALCCIFRKCFTALLRSTRYLILILLSVFYVACWVPYYPIYRLTNRVPFYAGEDLGG